MTPRATIAFLVYNQERYLDVTVWSCLNQECEPLEIILSDDASTDGSHQKLLKIAAQYHGPHQIKVRRNTNNLGIGEHYNRIIAESRGQLIITAAGDDIAAPHRAQTILTAWDQNHQQADLITSYLTDMSEEGLCLGEIHVSDLSQWQRPEDWCQKRPRVIGAAHAFTKRMHLHFGDFEPNLSYEDQVMSFRASCLGSGITIKESLLKYRRGGISSAPKKSQDRDALKEAAKKKFSNEAATYSQIKKDMAHQNLNHLWRGKVKRYLSRSQLALNILTHKTPTFREFLEAGLFWSIRNYFRLR